MAVCYPFKLAVGGDVRVIGCLPFLRPLSADMDSNPSQSSSDTNVR